MQTDFQYHKWICMKNYDKKSRYHNFILWPLFWGLQLKLHNKAKKNLFDVRINVTCLYNFHNFYKIY